MIRRNFAHGNGRAGQITMKLLALPFVLLPLLTMACGSDSDPSASEGTTPEGERAPIGKADQFGSCSGTKENFCGGKSAGNCWCDDLCEDIGDCCDDKPVACDGEAFCPNGKIETTQSYSEATNGMECSEPQQHCVTQDYGACPMYSPLPPDWCEDGEIVMGPNSYIPSTDAMECQLPSYHCVTMDNSDCPQLSPPSPDYCKDGQLVSGDSYFIPASDGKECEMPSLHCVTDDAAACEPAFCPEGTVVTETDFQDDGDMECSISEVHCVTKDWGACPLFSPPHPDYCKEGELVQGAPSYMPSADGMECEMPSLHCVTTDWSACPQLSPLPPDYCEAGQIMEGNASFMPSSDGMECEMPSVHCVSGACQ